MLDLSCPVRFEDMGFYIVWEPKGKDAGIIDLVTVSHHFVILIHVI